MIKSDPRFKNPYLLSPKILEGKQIKTVTWPCSNELEIVFSDKTKLKIGVEPVGFGLYTPVILMDENV